MGEAAEMMLDGTLCAGCGEYMEGESDGIPRYCSRECNPGLSDWNGVKQEAARDAKYQRRRRAQARRKVRQKERKQENLIAANQKEGWTKYTEFHWSKVYNGERVDYWPSKQRFKYMNKIHSGDPDIEIQKLYDLEMLQRQHSY